MKSNILNVFLFANLFVLISVYSGYTQPENSTSRFSHRGVKVALASGSFDMSSERQLEEGEGSLISLGYGFTDRFSLWLSITGTEHSQIDKNNLISEFSGFELNIQQKFETHSRLQPYGKVGFGIYSLEEKDSDVSLTGAGVNLAFGVDYFFSNHFGVGAELMFKKLDYFSQRQKTEGGEFVSDLYPDLNGDIGGFVITFTIQ